MAALIQRNGIYYAQFFDPSRTPQRKRHSLGTRKRDEARRRLATWEEAFAQGGWDPWIDDPSVCDPLQQPLPVVPTACTLGQAQEAFLDRRRRDGRSENTLRTYKEIIGLLVKAVGAETPLRSLRASHLEPIIRAQDLSEATQHKRFGHLRTFFRWCVATGFLSRSPLSEVAAPRKPHKLPKAVTEAELDRICREVYEEYYRKRIKGEVQEGELIWRVPLFRFALYTGMRASELARLRWRDVDFPKRLVYIRKQKNHKEQTIPLNTKAAQVLEDVPKGSEDDYVFRAPRTGTTRATRPFVERASRAFREARKNAGITRRISLHGLRHGFCTLLAERGAPLYVIQSAARHADLSTSLIYVHMANRQLMDALDNAFSGESHSTTGTSAPSPQAA